MVECCGASKTVQFSCRSSMNLADDPRRGDRRPPGARRGERGVEAAVARRLATSIPHPVPLLLPAPLSHPQEAEQSVLGRRNEPLPVNESLPVSVNDSLPVSFNDVLSVPVNLQNSEGSGIFLDCNHENVAPCLIAKENSINNNNNNNNRSTNSTRNRNNIRNRNHSKNNNNDIITLVTDLNINNKPVVAFQTSSVQVQIHSTNMTSATATTTTTTTGTTPTTKTTIQTSTTSSSPVNTHLPVTSKSTRRIQGQRAGKSLLCFAPFHRDNITSPNSPQVCSPDVKMTSFDVDLNSHDNSSGSRDFTLGHVMLTSSLLVEVGSATTSPNPDDIKSFNQSQASPLLSSFVIGSATGEMAPSAVTPCRSTEPEDQGFNAGYNITRRQVTVSNQYDYKSEDVWKINKHCNNPACYLQRYNYNQQYYNSNNNCGLQQSYSGRYNTGFQGYNSSFNNNLQQSCNSRCNESRVNLSRRQRRRPNLSTFDNNHIFNIYNCSRQSNNSNNINNNNNNIHQVPTPRCPQTSSRRILLPKRRSREESTLQELAQDRVSESRSPVFQIRSDVIPAVFPESQCDQVDSGRVSCGLDRTSPGSIAGIALNNSYQRNSLRHSASANFATVEKKKELGFPFGCTRRHSARSFDDFFADDNNESSVASQRKPLQQLQDIEGNSETTTRKQQNNDESRCLSVVGDILQEMQNNNSLPSSNLVTSAALEIVTTNSDAIPEDQMQRGGCQPTAAAMMGGCQPTAAMHTDVALARVRSENDVMDVFRSSPARPPRKRDNAIMAASAVDDVPETTPDTLQTKKSENVSTVSGRDSFSSSSMNHELEKEEVQEEEEEEEEGCEKMDQSKPSMSPGSDSGAYFEIDGLTEEEDEEEEKNKVMERSPKVKFSTEPIKVYFVPTAEEYNRFNEEIDPVGSAAVYELERRIEKMDLLEVDIEKDDYGLGINIIGMGVGVDSGLEKLGIFIKSLIEDGAAERDGRIRVGDQIIEVNGTSLVGVSHFFAGSTIKNTTGVVKFLMGRDRGTEEGHGSEVTRIIEESKRLDEEKNSDARQQYADDRENILDCGDEHCAALGEEYNAAQESDSVKDTESVTSEDVESLKEMCDIFNNEDTTISELDSQLLFIKLKETQGLLAATQSEVAKLKTKSILLDIAEEQRQACERKCEDMAQRLREADNSVLQLQKEVSGYQERCTAFEEQLQERVSQSEKKYQKAKKLIREYQQREKQFISERDAALLQQREKDELYNRMLQYLKDQIFALERRLDDDSASTCSYVTSSNGALPVDEVKINANLPSIPKTTSFELSPPKTFLNLVLDAFDLSPEESNRAENSKQYFDSINNKEKCEKESGEGLTWSQDCETTLIAGNALEHELAAGDEDTDDDCDHFCNNDGKETVRKRSKDDIEKLKNVQDQNVEKGINETNAIKQISTESSLKMKTLSALALLERNIEDSFSIDQKLRQRAVRCELSGTNSFRLSDTGSSSSSGHSVKSSAEFKNLQKPNSDNIADDAQPIISLNIMNQQQPIDADVTECLGHLTSVEYRRHHPHHQELSPQRSEPALRMKRSPTGMTPLSSTSKNLSPSQHLSDFNSEHGIGARNARTRRSLSFQRAVNEELIPSSVQPTTVEQENLTTRASRKSLPADMSVRRVYVSPLRRKPRVDDKVIAPSATSNDTCGLNRSVMRCNSAAKQDGNSTACCTSLRGRPLIRPRYSQIFNWGPEQVADWLETLGLKDHGDQFINAGVTGAQLLEIDNSRMKALGLKTSKERDTLHKKINDVKAALERERRERESLSQLNARNGTLPPTGLAAATAAPTSSAATAAAAVANVAAAAKKKGKLFFLGK